MNNESECFTGISKHEKIMVNTRARSASVFVHYFRVFGYPGETRAQFLTKHIVFITLDLLQTTNIDYN